MTYEWDLMCGQNSNRQEKEKLYKVGNGIKCLPKEGVSQAPCKDFFP